MSRSPHNARCDSPPVMTLGCVTAHGATLGPCRQTLTTVLRDVDAMAVVRVLTAISISQAELGDRSTFQTHVVLESTARVAHSTCMAISAMVESSRAVVRAAAGRRPGQRGAPSTGRTAKACDATHVTLTAWPSSEATVWNLSSSCFASSGPCTADMQSLVTSTWSQQPGHNV